jgi:hypothetical protein
MANEGTLARAEYALSERQSWGGSITDRGTLGFLILFCWNYDAA